MPRPEPRWVVQALWPMSAIAHRPRARVIKARKGNSKEPFRVLMSGSHLHGEGESQASDLHELAALDDTAAFKLASLDLEHLALRRPSA
jgi:hypothetical protein